MIDDSSMSSHRQGSWARLLVRADRYQREHRWAGLPVAVVFKFIEDQGGYLAALLTYYGFLSIFPLLMIATTVLGFVLAGTPGLREELLHTVLAEFPIVGDQLATHIHTLHGSVPALVIGALVSSYGALRVARAAQNALNQVWAIPRHAWPDPFRAYGRALVLIAGLAAAIIATTGLSWISTTTQALTGTLGSVLAVAVRAVATLLAAAVNAGAFLLAFRILTAHQIPLRDMRTGAIAAGITWQALLEIGTYYVARELHGVNAAYGLFSIVLVLMAWIYLGALITVLAAELNVIRADRLWPRSLRAAFVTTSELTRADRRAYSAYAAAQRHTTAQRVEVRFDNSDADTEAEAERTNPRLPRIDRDHPR